MFRLLYTSSDLREPVSKNRSTIPRNFRNFHVLRTVSRKARGMISSTKSTCMLSSQSPYRRTISRSSNVFHPCSFIRYYQMVDKYAHADEIRGIRNGVERNDGLGIHLKVRSRVPFISYHKNRKDLLRNERDSKVNFKIRQGRGLGRLSLSGPFVEQLIEERVWRTMDVSGDSRIANAPQLPQSGNVQGYARICQETSILSQHAAQL
ncbi:unnamed protein product [Albugo candida]|uniref:Uncharacterized protein n=1 Tax=Albugo candida TaxID=65357 RepID=A0A024GVL7_9STRA|nr:unnamed protein product [Albugo candida]|eukprot:CCI50424.1 unnamed protein product [Albugo candida]